MDRSSRRIVLKARQTGLSNAVAIEATHLALTQPDATIIFVSRNQQAARQLIMYCQHTLASLKQPPTLTIENQGELGFANRSRIISLPANPSTGRGFAATAVYLDEFAYAGYDTLIYESIIGTVSTGGRVTVLSTPNGRGNMFFRIWAGFEGGEWSRHRVHWSDCPLYTDEWAARTRDSMPYQSWAQEHECDFVASGEAVFRPDDLVAARQEWQGVHEDGWGPAITAWDIGRRQDHTVGITISQPVYAALGDPDRWHVRAFERFMAPYPEIQRRIEQRAVRFGGETWVESNGVGDPVIENLDVRVRPFNTGAKSKVQAIQALQLLLEQGRFKHNEDQLDRELGLYQWDDKALVQDAVMAAAIAAHAAVHGEAGRAAETGTFDYRAGRWIG